MKEIKVFEENEEVLIKAEVTRRELSGDSIRYILTDPRTNKEYKYPYSPDEVYPVSKEEKPVRKVADKK